MSNENESLIEELEYAILSFQHAGNLDRVRKAKDALRAALASRPAAGDGWMPIETAPHAQEVLLGWFDWAGDWLTEVSAASWGWRNERVSNISKHGSATHWRHLPPPPTAGSGEKG